MFAKSLIAASAIAASAFALAPADANAKTHWDIHVGVGVPAYPVYQPPVYVYEPPVEVYRPRYRVYAPTYDYYSGYDRYRYDRGYDRSYDYDRLSCRSGAGVVRDAGFRGVDAYDCSAPTYGYTGYKHGDLFKVRVNSGGDIISVRQID